MFPPRKILVIDHNTDNGALLVRTLSRKFPNAKVELCRESGAAVSAVGAEQIDVVVAHRSVEDDATALIRMLLAVAPDLPIIAVSSVDKRQEVLAAGAVEFMLYDEWLRIGGVISTLLEGGERV
jgi:CheY-like chemotaxis protein